MAPALPTWAGAAGDAPAAVGDQPGHEDRHHVGDPQHHEQSMIAYWTIRQRLLRFRAWPTSRSGASGSRCSRCRPIRNDGGRQRHARPGHGDHRRRAGRRAAAVLQGHRHRHRRLRRNRQPAVEHPSTCCRSSRRDDLPRSSTARRGSPIQLADVANVVETPPMIGDAVINDGPGLMMIVEKLPWANTLEVTRGVEEALEALKPGLPGSRSTPPSSGRPRSSRRRSTTSARRSSSAALLMVSCCSSSSTNGGALISVRGDPAVAAGGGWCSTGGATINTMILAGFVIALGDVVDDAIIDIENVVRRLREHRRDGRGRLDGTGHPQGLAGGARRHRLRHADRSRGRRAGLLPGRAVRRLLPAAGDRRTPSPCWCRWWWPSPSHRRWR